MWQAKLQMQKSDEEQGDASRPKDRRVTLEDVPARALSPSSIPMTHAGVCAKVDENSPRMKRRISHAGHAGVSPLPPMAAGCSEAEDVQEYALAFDTEAVQGDKGLFDILEVRLCDSVSRG